MARRCKKADRAAARRRGHGDEGPGDSSALGSSPGSSWGGSPTGDCYDGRTARSVPNSAASGSSASRSWDESSAGGDEGDELVGGVSGNGGDGDASEVGLAGSAADGSPARAASATPESGPSAAAPGGGGGGDHGDVPSLLQLPELALAQVALAVEARSPGQAALLAATCRTLRHGLDAPAVWQARAAPLMPRLLAALPTAPPALLRRLVGESRRAVANLAQPCGATPALRWQRPARLRAGERHRGAGGVAVSPSGARATRLQRAFVRPGRQHAARSAQLEVVDLVRRRGLRRVRVDGRVLQAAWAPNDRHVAVAYARHGSSRVLLLDADTGALSTCVELQRRDAPVALRWAPDGRGLLAQHAVAPFGGTLLTLVEVDVGAAPEARLRRRPLPASLCGTRRVVGASFAADGRSLLLNCDDDIVVWQRDRDLVRRWQAWHADVPVWTGPQTFVHVLPGAPRRLVERQVDGRGSRLAGGVPPLCDGWPRALDAGGTLLALAPRRGAVHLLPLAPAAPPAGATAATAAEPLPMARPVAGSEPAHLGALRPCLRWAPAGPRQHLLAVAHRPLTSAPAPAPAQVLVLDARTERSLAAPPCSPYVDELAWSPCAAYLVAVGRGQCDGGRPHERHLQVLDVAANRWCLTQRLDAPPPEAPSPAGEVVVLEGLRSLVVATHGGCLTVELSAQAPLF